MQIIYIMTYDCNFRCKYCDVYKKNDSISFDVINKSLEFIKNIDYKIDKVKFFGGEPLLYKDKIKYIIKNFPKTKKSIFNLTTNSILIDKEFMKFSKENNINLTFSLDGDYKTTGENRIQLDGKDLTKDIIKNVKNYSEYIKVNQVITTKNAKDFFYNFEFIYNLGVRKFNFLPSYYTSWTKKGLVDLALGFLQILEFYKKVNNFDLVNLENYSDVSFFNFGIVIDTDGTIYGTNLILSGKFEKYKKDLILGTIFDDNIIDIFNEENSKKYIEKISKIIEKEYTKDVLKSVRYIDLILNNFCNEFSK